jgi:ribosomal-protein-alanine N-acetyltransferase
VTAKIEIHEASLSQASTFAEIHAASFGKAAWGVEQIQSSLALETTRGWVAFQSGKCLGFILCQMGGDQIEVLTFAVHPSAQRQGTGEKLMSEAMALAKKAGPTALFLEVAADNTPARRLYKKLGLRETGTRPGYYRRNGIPVDAIFYEKSFRDKADASLPKAP